jgi:hypothetical protein
MATVDYKKFSKKKLMPPPVEKVDYLGKGFNSLTKIDNMRRLLKYKDMYDKLYEFRKNRRRNIDYTFGKQWNDIIDDPDSPYGKGVTEEVYIKRQGKVPLKNNLIRQLNKSVLGTFRGNKTEPTAIARDRDEQKVGEMMSIAMQYAYQNNDLWEVDARTLEEFLISGFCVQITRFKWWRSRQIYDVYVAQENPSRCFFNSDMSDPRGDDLRTFGVVRDMTIAEVLEQFAKTREDAVRIKDLYRYTDAQIAAQYDAFTNRRFREMDFFIPVESSMCRVIEAWSLESKERIRVHDTLSAETYVVEVTQKGELDAQNAQRTAEAVAQGVDAQDVPLINFDWFIDQYWYVQYLTPTGEVLFESETPFEHKDQPFSIKAYPLVDGEVHSFVEDVIDQQRYINRLVTMIDFIMGASAKGVLIFPEEALGDMDKKQVLDEWVKYNGVIFAKTKGGTPLPQQVSTNATNVGAYELLNIQLKLMSDISGVHDALQGKSPGSGTPANLYAQETQNAATNLLDLFESFNSFRRQRDYKMMKTIQQYYDSPRYINIAGKDYSEESKFYDPQKIRNSEFDVAIAESPSTPAYRTVMNGFLLELFKTQAIDVKTLLENSAYPFADRVLSSIQRKEDEMKQMQAGAGAMPGAGGAPLEAPPEMQQAADPKAMELFNQMMQGKGAA